MNYHIDRLVLSSLCVGVFVAADIWWCSFRRLQPGSASSSKPRPWYKYHVLLSLFILHTLHPALEDGTDRGFRNVGKPQSDAGEIPKRIHTRLIYVTNCRTSLAHNCMLNRSQVTPWLRELVVGLSPWGIRFNPRYVHVALNRFLSKYLSSPNSINPPATDNVVKYLTKN